MNELIKNLRRGFAFLGSAAAPRFEPLGRTHFLDARRRSAQSVSNGIGRPRKRLRIACEGAEGGNGYAEALRAFGGGPQIQQTRARSGQALGSEDFHARKDVLAKNTKA